MTSREGDKLRLGVFGGSFNPPHLAHQMILTAALEADAIDLIWMLPTFQHAFGKELAPYEDRVAMCERLAARFGGAVVVSRLESELGGESRTLPLLIRIAELLPSASLRLVIGADILAEAGSWLGWDEVIRRAPPLVFGRAGEAAVGGDELTIPDISSTRARALLAERGDASSLLPSAVLRYIVARGLYGTGDS